MFVYYMTEKIAKMAGLTLSPRLRSRWTNTHYVVFLFFNGDLVQSKRFGYLDQYASKHAR